MEIQIISGFFGAGKTTFLNKYLPLLNGKTAVIENGSGDIPLDKDLIQEDVLVRDLYAGCICCSLAFTLRKEIRAIAAGYHPDRIIIEPSGVGKLSDIVDACMRTGGTDGLGQISLKTIVLVDLSAFEECEEAFGAFYLDQIEHARLLLFSGLDRMESEQKENLIKRVRDHNPTAVFYGDDWRKLDGQSLLELIQRMQGSKEGHFVRKDHGWKTIINKGRLKNAPR